MKTPTKKHSSGYSRLKTRYEILEDKFKKQEKLLHRYRNYSEGLKVDLEEKIKRIDFLVTANVNLSESNAELDTKIAELNDELPNIQNSFETTVQSLKASTELRQEYRFTINQMVGALKEADLLNRKRKIAEAISIAERTLNSQEL